MDAQKSFTDGMYGQKVWRPIYPKNLSLKKTWLG
jgi:hypothetical protein